jgi:hypothetical protein
MRKMFWTIVALGILGASLQASAQTACDEWLKEWDKRTQVFNSQCVGSSRNLSRNEYCKLEGAVLETKRFRILQQCH